MRLVSFCLSVLTGFSITTSALAASKPPEITWQWFNAAVIHQKQNSPRGEIIAAHYYRLAAERGNAPAAYRLGEMSEEGRGVAQSYETALKWYRLAAAQRDRYALFKLGLFLQKGWGVDRDAAQAARAYAASAEAGNDWAYHMLAFMLADGDGIARNEALAMRYFERSLPKTDDHWAKWKLATLIRDRDPARASRLLAEAARAGNPEALKLAVAVTE